MKVIVIGGGWAGCAAAITAKNAGAQVSLYEKTDMLLGLGNVGGIMRNNGRFTASEELIALGGGELIHLTDKNSRHKNMDFPGHKHACRNVLRLFTRTWYERSYFFLAPQSLTVT